MKYEAEVEFTFKSNVIIEADSKKEAMELIKNYFHCQEPSYNGTDIRILDWDGEASPEGLKITL